MRITEKPGWAMFLNWKGYLLGIVLVAIATVLKYLAQPNIIPADVPLLYFAAIVPTAIFFGLGPSLLVCIFSYTVFDYFFISPLHTLSPPNIQNTPILLIFLLVGILLSLLSSSLRYRTQQALREITTRKATEANLVQANQQLKLYGQRITRVQEEERKRIAYELHDDTVQYLAILKLQIDSILQSGKIQDAEIIEKLQYLQKDAGRAADDVRRYSHELRPSVLDYLGLRAALEQSVEDINKLKQISVEMNVEGEEPAMPDEVKLGLFRIAQEALSNARKHAKANLVIINLEFKEDLTRMEIVDKGSGFEMQPASIQAVSRGSMGLLSMQERASFIGANLIIQSIPGLGTSVLAEIAVQAPTRSPVMPDFRPQVPLPNSSPEHQMD